MSSAVVKLEALLARVQRNRAKPRTATLTLARSPAREAAEAKLGETAPGAALRAVESVRPGPAPAASKPALGAVQAPASSAEPPTAPSPSTTGRPKPVEPARAESPSALRDLGEARPGERERKKTPASPLELAVESSVELPLGLDENEVPTAVAPAKAKARAAEGERESETREPAGAELPEPERIAAEALAGAAPVAKVASAFVASKPATFGELLERTLHLEIR